VVGPDVLAGLHPQHAPATVLDDIVGAEQPTLIVDDLKHGADAKGVLALRIGPGTLAHFSGARVTS
jgi:hypothetical protein